MLMHFGSFTKQILNQIEKLVFSISLAHGVQGAQIRSHEDSAMRCARSRCKKVPANGLRAFSHQKANGKVEKMMWACLSRCCHLSTAWLACCLICELLELVFCGDYFFHCLRSFTNVRRLSSEFKNFNLLLVRRRIFWDCDCLLVGKMYGLVDDHNEAFCTRPRRQLLEDDLVLDLFFLLQALFDLIVQSPLNK